MKCNRCGHEGFDPGAGICEHCHIVLYQSDVEAKDKRIAALEAEREKDAEVVLATAKATDDLAAQNVQQRERIAALEAEKERLKNASAEALYERGHERIAEVRREGARKGMIYERKQEALAPDDWVIPTDAEIDVAIGGEVKP